MPVTIAQLVLDCADAEKLAAFWSAALNRPVAPGAGPYFAQIPGEFALMFLAVPEAKQGKNRLHLDLSPRDGSDARAELERLLALGATQVSEHDEHGVRWVGLQDSEGNEFDLGLPST